MVWNSIQHAHAFWKARWEEEAPTSDFEHAEAFILQRRPVTIHDAACILDVICAYNGDGRTDELDRDALLRLRGLLHQLDDGAVRSNVSWLG